MIALMVAAFGTAVPASAPARVHVPASLVAELTILEDPAICRKIHRALHTVGYEIAEEAYEAGYGYNKHPSAAAVFHALVRQCRGR